MENPAVTFYFISAFLLLIYVKSTISDHFWPIWSGHPKVAKTALKQHVFLILFLTLCQFKLDLLIASWEFFSSDYVGGPFTATGTPHNPFRPSRPPSWPPLTLKAFPLTPEAPETSRLSAWPWDLLYIHLTNLTTKITRITLATPTTLTTLTILTKLTTLTILATLTDQKIHNEHKYRFCIVYLVYLYNLSKSVCRYDCIQVVMILIIHLNYVPVVITSKLPHSSGIPQLSIISSGGNMQFHSPQYKNKIKHFTSIFRGRNHKSHQEWQIACLQWFCSAKASNAN